MSETDAILRTEELTRLFDGFAAVESVDFAVRRDELRGIIGPNGAGKTTFFDLITGSLDVTRGRIVYRGDDITDLPAHRRAKRGIAKAFQVTSVFPDLTVLDNTIAAANARHRVLNPVRNYRRDAATRERAAAILDRVGLDGQAGTVAQNLSHADQKLLEIALVLATDPSLILLDEPTAGLSASDTDRIKSLVDDLRDEATILLVEHDMDVVLDLADAITVLHDGQVLAEGSPAEISENAEVQDVYFGR